MNFLKKYKDNFITDAYLNFRSKLILETGGDYKKAIDKALEFQLNTETTMAHLTKKRFALFKKSKLFLMEIYLEAARLTIKSLKR